MVVTRDIAAPRSAVWDVLADGWTYSQWVVGNSRLRAVDADWPAEGTKISHSIGIWPAVVDDDTLVLSCRPQEELVLLAKLGPVGAAEITLQLSDIADGCRIEMGEVPVSGPMSVIPDRLAALAVTPRNRECLWRLDAVARRRLPAELG